MLQVLEQKDHHTSMRSDKIWDAMNPLAPVRKTTPLVSAIAISYPFDFISLGEYDLFFTLYTDEISPGSEAPEDPSIERG